MLINPIKSSRPQEKRPLPTNRGFFDFSENPFSTTLDPAVLYLGKQYQNVSTSLVQAIQDRKGLIGLVGKSGTGKTLLMNAVVDKLDKKTSVAFLRNYSKDIPFAQLLAAALVDLKAAKTTENLSGLKAIERLEEFAIRQMVSGGNIVLVVDDAQSLGRDVLLNLYLLSNLGTRKHPLIQIVLVGQPKLKDILASSFLGRIDERITTWFEIETLDHKEVGFYIKHHLTLGNAHNRIHFTHWAVAAIYSHSHGVPRIINTLCDRALLIAYYKEKSAVTLSIVRKALADLRRPFQWQDLYHTQIPKLLAFCLVALVVAPLFGWIQRDKISDFFSSPHRIAHSQVQPTFLEPVAPLENTPTVQEAPDENMTQAAEPGSVANVAMDSRTSLAMLFSLFNQTARTKTDAVSDEAFPVLFTFKGELNLYRSFRKPFRLKLRSEEKDRPFYLVIHKVTQEGAVALDAAGNEQPLSEDMILSHWEGEMSWVYPSEKDTGNLVEGMEGPEVLRVQQMLAEIGYPVEPTGIFDSTTSEKIANFKRGSWLNADGVVDRQTISLLYQMSS